MSFKRVRRETIERWNSMKIAELNDEQQAAVNYRGDQNLCLVAGAGSGKTRVLTYRYLDLIINDGKKPREIACLTYTTAAANEMKDRIIRKLVELNEIELLREIETAYISTIHAFALRLITENSLLTGFDPSYLDLSAVERNILIRESYDALSQIIREEFDDDQNAIFSLYKFDNIAHIVYKLIDVMRDNGLGIEHLKTLQSLSADEVKDLAREKFLSDDFKKKAEGEVNFIEKVRKPVMSLSIREFSNQKEIKAQMRRFEFIDYLESLKKLLKSENSPVQNQFSEILVDEFQDTNEFQYSLVRDACGKTSRVFAVGDAKQSIYRFQQAEIGVFADYASSEQTHVLELKTNYRSHPYIVSFCNDIFKPAMLATKKEIQFENLDRALIAGTSDNSPVKEPRIEVLLINRESRDYAPVKENKKDKQPDKKIDMKSQAHELKADFVARRIQRLVQDSDVSEKFRYKDVAILVRRKATAAVYREALSKLGIPALIFGGVNLLRQPVVLDVFYLLKFLVNQDDDINFAALLKTSFVGVSDDILFWISQKRTEYQRAEKQNRNDDKARVSLFEAAIRLHKGKMFTAKNILPAEVLAVADANEINNFNKYLTLLNEFLDAYTGFESEIRNMMPLEILDLSMNKLDFVHKIGAYSDDRTAEANFYVFRDLIIELQQRNNFLFPVLVAHLQKLIDMKIDVEEAAPSSGLIDDERDAVKIMTIHKAKGLEFPAVFVVETEENASNEREYDINGNNIGTQSLFVDREIGLCGKYYRIDKQGEMKPDTKLHAYHKDLYEKSKRENLLENFRMFYVAMTRAERFLFLAGVSTFESAESDCDEVIEKLMNDELTSTDYETLLSLMKQGKLTKNFTNYLRRLLRIKESPDFEDQRDATCEEEYEDVNFKDLNVRRWFYIDEGSKLQKKTAGDTVSEENVEEIRKAYELAEGEFKIQPQHFSISATQLGYLLTCPKMYEFSLEKRFFAFEDANSSLTDYDETLDKSSTDAKNLGTFFHKVFEKLNYTSTANLSKSVETALAKHKKNSTFYNELKKLTDKVLEKQNFWEDVCSADEVYTELPVFVTHANITFNGFVDLLAEFDDRLIIIDFKTDTNFSDKTLRFRYMNQLKLYCFVLMERMKIIGKSKKIQFSIFASRQEAPPVLFEYTESIHKEISERLKESFNSLRNQDFLAKISNSCKYCLYSGICKEYQKSKKRKSYELF